MVLALGAALGAQAAQAAPLRSCDLSVRDREPPGRTPAYKLRVQVANTSCRAAIQAMRSFHRCRTYAGRSCARRLLGVWRCTGTRDASTPTSHGSFSCRWGRRRMRSTYWQDTPHCFGAAARDPKLPCSNRSPTIVPAPGMDDPDGSWVCDPGVVPGACVFGVAPAAAREHFALLGDSHTLAWQAALSVVARVKHWRGYSIATGGCFFSAAVGSFLEGCRAFYETQLSWLRDHPEVSTVFVTSNADTPVAVPAGETYESVKIDGFRRAWEAVPKTVKHIVVLRDTTITTPAAFECVYAAVAAAEPGAGQSCPLARSYALRPDIGVATVRLLHSPRFAQIDLTGYLCGPVTCPPVVGGALVNGDIYGHLNATFMRTLGPYLIRALDRLRARW